MTSNNVSPRRLRLALLASVCAGGLMTTPQAAAQSGAAAGTLNSFDIVDSQMSGATSTALNPAELVDSQMSGPPAGTIRVSEVVDSPSITINNNFTPNDVRDPNNITGIGQVITDSGGGFIGTCTGSLINPRTVIFAAHCVNTRAATAYGAPSGGVGTMVGFETNTRANAAGQVDELLNWLLGSGAGPGQFRTNQAQALYNVSQVFYDPRSLAPASCTNPTACFLEADIATAVLDTPTRNIPTWALLFSPLDAPASINPATGTGYHVTIAGYGNTGTGTTGASTSGGFRRRAAENMLGALVSIDQRNAFLFGTTGVFRPQPLYFLDFDDPARGTPAANTRDFNGFRDNALPREGLTGPGDSGGPLILDQTFQRQVVIGVLSGGSTFFGGQTGGSYGTHSFYQPLFLYWDWIVANNPYRYVTATAGNRNWEDATGWVTELDPNYNIIVNGQLVNGLPTNLGAANAPGSLVGFGELCFQSGATNECQDIRTGAARSNVPNTPNGQNPTNSAGIERVAANGEALSASESAQNNGFTTVARPAATIANGLPGATNFVPNNVDGVRTTGTLGRYYDVTLRNAGAVTLNSTVTIDRFAISGATSQLNIAANASLTSLIDVRHNTGTISNNGALITPGDYLLTSGLLQGTGRVRAPFLTSVMGTIAPGTTTTIGTLTVEGNLVLSSGSSLMINLGSNLTSDLLAVRMTGPGTGSANLGGGVFFSTAGSYRPTAGDTFTFLTADSGITGSFSTVSAPFSAILSPVINVGANVATVQIRAASYRTVLSGGSQSQRAYARLLDENRGNPAIQSALYAELDLLTLAALRSNLDALGPNTVPMQNDIGYASTEVLSSFLRDRIGRVSGGELGGTIATYGSPLTLAAQAIDSPNGQLRSVSDSGQPMQLDEGKIAEDISLFLAGGYVDGRGSGLPGAAAAGRSKYDGYYIIGGAEKALEDGSFIGFAAAYSDIDGSAPNTLAASAGRLFQGSIYGSAMIAKNLSVDVQVSAGQLKTETSRTVPLGGLVETLESRDNVTTYSGESGISYHVGDENFAVTPRLSLRYSSLNFTPTAETGGATAIRYDLGKFESIQGRAGVSTKARKGTIRPFVSVDYVHEFEDRPAEFGINFRNGIGSAGIFTLPTTDSDWVEVGGGLTIGGENFNASLSADTQFGRSDIRTKTVRGSLLWRF